MIGVHVDDCIAGGSKRFEEQILKRLRSIIIGKLEKQDSWEEEYGKEKIAV